jgi:hypothetical protein
VMADPRGDGYTALGMAFDSLLPCRRSALDRLGDWLWNGYRTGVLAHFDTSDLKVGLTAVERETESCGLRLTGRDDQISFDCLHATSGLFVRR